VDALFHDRLSRASLAVMHTTGSIIV